LVSALQGCIEPYFLQDHGVFPKNTVCAALIGIKLEMMMLMKCVKEVQCA